jgi:hypothetical protein
MLYGLKDFKALVSEIAYYKWLNGSEDTEKNWTEAVAEALKIINGLN